MKMAKTIQNRESKQNIPRYIVQSWVEHKIGSKVTEAIYTKTNKDVDNKYIDILNNSKFYSNSTHK